jgi:hypothetical protein
MTPGCKFFIESLWDSAPGGYFTPDGKRQGLLFVNPSGIFLEITSNPGQKILFNQ